MKKEHTLLLLILTTLIVLLGYCSDDFLDIRPAGEWKLIRVVIQVIQNR